MYPSFAYDPFAQAYLNAVYDPIIKTVTKGHKKVPRGDRFDSQCEDEFLDDIVSEKGLYLGASSEDDI